MNAILHEPAAGDGRTTVALPALIALREQVARVRLAERRSHLRRSGQQSSRLIGRGMDYAESRAYQAGDDVRRLDWRLTARSGKLHTKLFEEDREGSALILVDRHASMRFGTRVRFKSVQAALVAAAVAWSAARAGERVGLVGFGAGMDEIVRPAAGMRGALAVCGALARWDAAATVERAEPLSAALARARPWLHGASRVILVSDGFHCDEAARAPLRELGTGSRLGCVLVADALELELPAPGLYPMEGQGGRELVALTSDAERRHFLQAMHAGADALLALAAALGARCVTLDGSGDACAAAAHVLAAPRGHRA